ncbi:AbrB family transcriptional regulator [Neosynechococcus sphagnicola]|uniref:AbrB family transcriptional regulator n=1 Tax=Neosynechococcus sphagnicola TaxID=1501145 RepID=UPI0006900B96|nr:AbrB family transcriptional regulator [Neosynechococcus sphagnicola]
MKHSQEPLVLTEPIFLPAQPGDPWVPPWLVVSLELILSAVIGGGLVTLQIGSGAWILGGIAAGAIVFYLYRGWFNPQAKPHPNARKIGQMLVGLTVGCSLQHSDLTSLSAQFPIFIGLACFLLVSGVMIGSVYSRLAATDVLTGLLATVPGNIGVMASIAADYGKNYSPGVFSAVDAVHRCHPDNSPPD